MLFSRHHEGGQKLNSYILQLFDSRKKRQIDGVTSFVGEDASGSFGILPDHARMMTVLVFGLARFRCGEQVWQYVAMSGALLYFADNTLNLVCQHYLIDEDYNRISKRLIEELIVEEEQLREVRKSLKHMEKALLKRMWQMGRQGVKLS
jgi:F-type H+-transporting ATPase subunit epsilon